MRRSSILALALLSFGALLPAACTQDFGIFDNTGGSSSSSSSGGTTCTTNADCNDTNACTTDTCDTATGKCSYANVTDGPVPGENDTKADCKTQRCVDGKETTVEADDEVPDDGNPCTTDTCSGGQAQHADVAQGTECGTANGATLICDGMGSCVGCTMDSECTDPGECKTRTCDAANTCQFGNEPEHEPCSTGVCNGNGACIGCVDDSDCGTTQNGICTNNKCVNHCNDNAKNGNETDVDCGGFCPTKCADTKTCNVNGDCASNRCTNGICTSCNDNAKNGSETDVDCGGFCSTKCADTKTCTVNGDCASNRCTAGICTSCNDTVKNGNETDVDCGGSCTTKCAAGKACVAGTDCTSGTCTANVCAP